MKTNTEIPRRAALRPGSVPEPPKGYDYWGFGPIPDTSEGATNDIVRFVPGGSLSWITAKSVGYAADNTYALRRGSEAHRKNFGEMTDGHPHAELMAEYAKDALETDRPWERWESRHVDDAEYIPLATNPHWYRNHEYRRKPEPAPTAAEWLEFAKGAGYDPRIIAYIEADPANRWCPGMGRVAEKLNNWSPIARHVVIESLFGA